MPLQINELTAEPECIGEQWFAEDLDRLAHLVAHVLIGKSRHAARVIHGAEHEPLLTSEQLKERLREQLILSEDAQPYHRDGLLFETICWIVAHMRAAPGDLISAPHLQSTQQGTDMLKVSIDGNTAGILKATIYEQKCTTSPRDKFRDDVLDAFGEYVDGKRDSDIAQATLSLTATIDLTDDQERAIHARLLRERPFAFNAGLTVSPEVFTKAQCVALFAGFRAITPNIEDRQGNTFPVDDIRTWFAAFAERVWAFIEAAEDV